MKAKSSNNTLLKFIIHITIKLCKQALKSLECARSLEDKCSQYEILCSTKIDWELFFSFPFLRLLDFPTSSVVAYHDASHNVVCLKSVKLWKQKNSVQKTEKVHETLIIFTNKITQKRLLLCRSQVQHSSIPLVS